jgi:hypothetical protein
MRWASSGVSPSATWLGSARRDPARQCTLRPGGVRQGLRWQHGGPTGLPCRLHWWTRCGDAGQSAARRGMAGSGDAIQGSQTVARRLRPPCHPHKGWTRWCQAARASARTGRVRHGLAWLGYGCRQQHGASTEAPCCSLWRADVAGHGAGWQGQAQRCQARLGMAKRGAVRADDLSTGGFGLLCWVLLNPATARHVATGLGQLRLGMTWHGMPNADDLSTEGASPP